MKQPHSDPFQRPHFNDPFLLSSTKTASVDYSCTGNEVREGGQSARVADTVDGRRADDDGQMRHGRRGGMKAVQMGPVQMGLRLSEDVDRLTPKY